MRILIVTQYFTPESGATSNRLESFARGMADRGHDVTVICEFPNHPAGKLRPKDKWRLFRWEKHDNYKILRTAVLAFEKKNNIKRMLFYLSFAFTSFIGGLLVRRADVVFTSSPPIFHAYTAMLAARIRGSHFVLDIRDLWPDSALEIEAVSNKFFLKLGSFIEKQIYNHASLIFAVSKGIKEKIEQRGGQDKTHVAYNGSFEKILNWSGENAQVRSQPGWSDKTVVLYAGLMGLGQGLTNLIPEIQSMPNSNLSFIFIGEGVEKNLLDDKIKELKIENMRLVDSMPLDDVIPYMYAADFLFVILRDKELFKSAIPSKFFDCMAVGKPILSNVDGELREIMEKNSTGLYFSLKEPGSLKKAIETLINSPDKRIEMGENGKKLVASRFLRSKITAEAVKLIEDQIKI